MTDTNGTVLATFTYDSTGVPVGSDPATAPRSYYVYNGHGDTVALVDAAGNTVASYGYDSFGLLMSDTERFANGWSNPYRYDGRDGVRYDRETGLYWMSVRAYDPAPGRFLARDPLGRSPLFFADQPYVYAGNNPLVNVDPSGQRIADASDAQVRKAATRAKVAAAKMSRMTTHTGGRCDPDAPRSGSCKRWGDHAQKLRSARLSDLQGTAFISGVVGASIQILALILDFWAEQGIKKLELVLNILSVFGTILVPNLGGWIQTTNPSGKPWLRWAQFIAAGANSLIAIVAGAIGLYKTWGWLAQNAVDLAIFAVQGAIAGIPGALEQVVLKILGGAIALIGLAFANQFYAIMNTSNAEYNRESQGSLLNWCQRFSHGECGPLPTD